MTPDPDALPNRVPTFLAKLTAIVVAVTLGGCAPVPQSAADREQCYNAANLQTSLDVAQACPGKPWSTCPERPGILAAGQAREAACK